jgi:hypothetical protein
MREQRRLVAALGLRTVEGTQRISWCAFAAEVERWSYGTTGNVRLQSGWT